MFMYIYINYDQSYDDTNGGGYRDLSLNIEVVSRSKVDEVVLLHQHVKIVLRHQHGRFPLQS
jgi:hypothetical protein